MIFRPDRRTRGPDPVLGHKMLLFVVGAILAVIGIATERNWIVYVAIAFLLAGVVLRFLRRPHDDEPVD
jgi:membrane protein implicated in regulation of membrane protease activity